MSCSSSSVSLSRNAFADLTSCDCRSCAAVIAFCVFIRFMVASGPMVPAKPGGTVVEPPAVAEPINPLGSPSLSSLPSKKPAISFEMWQGL